MVHRHIRGTRKFVINSEAEFVLDELAGYAALRDEPNGCEVSCVDRIWEAKTLLDSKTLSLLNSELQQLRDHQLDGVSRISDTSTDIIDPFMHCLVYRRTLAYGSGSGQDLRSEHPPAGILHDEYTLSRRFVCLATPFRVSPETDCVQLKALSYINNVDPSHTALNGYLISASATDIKVLPGGPEYRGTPWRIEGMRNEHIVACAMFCASMVNLTPPCLEFRMSITSPRGIAPGDPGATLRTWGLVHHSPCNQRLGGVTLRPGIAVAYPNIYQHRVTSASLEDPAFEGSMTIISLFLVDPELDQDSMDATALSSTPSTERVPPQQKEWMRRAVEESIDIRIPVEIVEHIIEMVEGLMTDEEARMYAKEMRAEREQFWKLHDERRFCLPFDIWRVL
ncbi:hypothetical protein A0H81_11485 [Grifola frondosa]|uniref:DUF4246 domain-containing protein n=1 Tax=Grifola frondosa TaxID=5627 RepID=A0A1C7LW56_GRIFR|nr:hypothetical protein A0H81_11485 [Grifola frondosa]